MDTWSPAALTKELLALRLVLEEQHDNLFAEGLG